MGNYGPSKGISRIECCICARLCTLLKKLRLRARFAGDASRNARRSIRDSCSVPKAKRCQTADKPGSVRTRGYVTTIRLGRTSRRASRDQPGRRSGNAPVPFGTAAPIRSCSRWGLPCRPRYRGRGALLPHHFALARGLSRDACAGGVVSVALSLGSPPPAVSRHRFPVEPGLSSSVCTPAVVWPSGRVERTTDAHSCTRIKA